MKTRTYLVLMAAAILIPVVAFSVTGLQMMLERERTSQIDTVQETARATALLIDQEITGAQSALGVIISTLLLDRDDLRPLYELISRGEKGESAWTAVYDDEGRVILNTRLPFGSTFPKLRPWVIPVIAAGQPHVSNLREGLGTGEKVISVSQPVTASNGRKYLISRMFMASHFNDMLRSPGVGPNWIVGLFGADSVSIARYPKAEQLVGQPVSQRLFEASRSAFSGRTRHVTREDIAVYSVFTKTSKTGWTVAIGVPEKEIEEPARRAASFAALAMGTIFTVAGLLILLLARRLTRSVDEVVASAGELARGLIPASRKTGVAEVDVLQASMHDAGQALARENGSRLALEEERKDLLRSEQEARRQAERQNRNKDDFLAMLAHELRNPLAPISSAAHLLRVVARDEDRVRQCSEVISRQVGHMTELVNDLLDVSRVSRGLVQMDMQLVNIDLVLDRAIEQARPLITARRQQLTEAPRPGVELRCDATRLTQAVSNLLNNAAKFTPEGGLITVSAALEQQELVIRVSDNGAGIDPTLLPHVFDLFIQGERTPDRSQGGLGLGLALVKNIVMLHGGKVHAQSDGTGKGSVFTLVLPADNQALDARSEPKAELLAKPVTSGRPLRIMAVDDNADALQTLSALLQAKGHNVSKYQDSGSALRAAATERPEVFVLDIGLPDMDGFELARRLRASGTNDGAVLVALTGYGRPEDRARSHASGFDHHLVKPVDDEALTRILAQAVARRG
ncbi:MAG: hybrid sensor histidine kinase/response regulator [Polaromonas sp.]|nr:hybrid sensor histidine kinase/response regulator [Polaromonas sp.]